MNWLVMFLVSLLAPVVQPALQQGVQRVQTAVQAKMQPASAAPKYVFHQGRWWKYEGGQWYYEVLPQEKMAWNQTPLNSSVR